jgi:hypothetical protein
VSEARIVNGGNLFKESMVSETPGDVWKFKFTGDALLALVQYGKEQGIGVAACDGEPVDDIMFQNRWNGGHHLVFCKDVGDGDHTFTIEHKAGNEDAESRILVKRMLSLTKAPPVE